MAACGIAAIAVSAALAVVAAQEPTFEAAVLKRNTGADSGQLVDQAD